MSSLFRANPAIALVVEDDGPGVPELIRDRVVDPFFTTFVDTARTPALHAQAERTAS